MFTVACVLLSLAVGGLADAVTYGTTLEMTFLVHRHGDRTPVDMNIALTTDPDAVKAASAQYGSGQLTNVGKKRSYKLGQYIKKRYSRLLSSQYNRSDIYIRSTDSTRAKMTVLVALAAVYPPFKDNWSQDINWTPVPYTTVPIKYDFNMAIMNCPSFYTAYDQAMFSNPPIMDQYADVMEVLAKVSGDSMVKTYPAISFGYHDAYVSQESLGVPLSDEIAAIMPRLSEAAGVAMDVILGNEDMVNLAAGVLLNEFFTYASMVTSGEDTPRVRLYSAHDTNVYSFMAAARISPRQGVPKYASAFALELRRVIKTGRYVVLAVYKPDPSEDVIYLPVAGCNLLCDLRKFQKLVSNNLLDENTWRTKCGFTEDLAIDYASIS